MHEILLGVQRGAPVDRVRHAIPPRRVFPALLAEVTEAYYSHPLAREEIGYMGMGDARGWQAMGLNELDAREPRPVVVPRNVPTSRAAVS